MERVRRKTALAEAYARRCPPRCTSRIEQLKKLYADEVVRSPVAGSLSATVPSVGNAYRPGEKMLTVYSGESYVLQPRH
jgi:hypothetical protein